MSNLIVRGGRRLQGTLALHGAKNAVLPILSAAFLCEGESVLYHCPRLTDVELACAILRELGCRVRASHSTITVDASGASGTVIPAEYMCEMRSSIVFLGAMLARTGRAELCAPGGCNLGPRPIDQHLSALRQMGAQIIDENGTLHCTAPNGLRGCTIRFPFVSVGATENVMIAAATARGVTRIDNAAREPEVADLARYLNRCGARIHGAGTSELCIEGVKRLHGAEHRIVSDRIETATYLAAAAVTGGDVCLKNTDPTLLRPVLARLQEAGCALRIAQRQIHLTAPARLTAFSAVRTAPYPAFPTDAQAIMMAAAAPASGTVQFDETIFSDRFRHVPELNRMGADITVSGETALVRGVPKLHGAAVRATDLRGGAAMVIAALCAEGTTTISDVYHIDRGYEKIEAALTQLNADVGRETAWVPEKSKTPCPVAAG